MKKCKRKACYYYCKNLTVRGVDVGDKPENVKAQEILIRVFGPNKVFPICQKQFALTGGDMYWLIDNNWFSSTQLTKFPLERLGIKIP